MQSSSIYHNFPFFFLSIFTPKEMVPASLFSFPLWFENILQIILHEKIISHCQNRLREVVHTRSHCTIRAYPGKKLKSNLKTYQNLYKSTILCNQCQMKEKKKKKKRNKCIIFLTMHYILIRIYNYTTWVHLHTTLNVDLTLTTTPIFRVPCNSSKKPLSFFTCWNNFWNQNVLDWRHQFLGTCLPQ